MQCETIGAVFVFCFLLFSSSGAARPQDSMRGWGPEQALGAPDTESAGDQRTAWASKTPDDQPEWLELYFARPVRPLAVRVFETFNPGALVAVELQTDSGERVTAWSGTDPTPSGKSSGISLIPIHDEREFATVRLLLASPEVLGWNEIDAVALHGLDGSMQWALDARASSTFASGPALAVGYTSTGEETHARLDDAHRTPAEGLLAVYREALSEPMPDDGAARASRERILDSLAREILRIQRGDTPARGFAGSWGTTFGTMVLEEEGERIHGWYALGGRSTIEGRLEDGRLVFEYEESDARGEGWFELSADDQSFEGEWRVETEERMRPWAGRRISRKPDPDRVWLCILESPWQGIREPEYSFGEMLEAIFAANAKVAVRLRSLHDTDDLVSWCQELSTLAEPVYLVVAAHGSTEGIQAHGGAIPEEALARAIASIPTLRLAHFSSCGVMGGSTAERIFELRSKDAAPLVVSGYEVSVDWMASAITEFLLLDLVLNRDLAPEVASREVLRYLDFAGRDTVEGGAVPAAHFAYKRSNGSN